MQPVFFRSYKEGLNAQLTHEKSGDIPRSFQTSAFTGCQSGSAVNRTSGLLDRFASDRQCTNTLASQLGNSVGQCRHYGRSDWLADTARLLTALDQHDVYQG
jgi:hypothetical protein